MDVAEASEPGASPAIGRRLGVVGGGRGFGGHRTWRHASPVARPSSGAKTPGALRMRRTGYIPYCASKAGVINLTKSLAKTLAPHIQVNCINPGPVLLPADFSEEEKQTIIEKTPLKRIGSPQDIANTVVYLIESSDFITGTTITVDGGRIIA